MIPMANQTVTYACPNCGAPLTYNPATKNFTCDFCASSFTEEEVKAHKIGQNEGEDTSENAKQTVDDGYDGADVGAEEQYEGEDAEVREYICPNCGAEIMTDPSTVATFCYYCHSPVVLSERVSGMVKPQKVIPFRLDKEAAQQKFLSYIKKKWFVPKNYFSKEQMETMSGIYFPFWVTDADTEGTYETIAHRVRSWREGDYEYTETRNYLVRRRGKIHFEDIVTAAISSEDKQMLEGILPFPPAEHKPFEMPYLLGFGAKKRDVTKEQVVPEVRERIHDYSRTILRGTVHGYTSVDPGSCHVREEKSTWEYALMPVWLMTYRNKKGKLFYYAMNGCTGKLYGELPISFAKLAALFAGVAALALPLLILLFGGMMG